MHQFFPVIVFFPIFRVIRSKNDFLTWGWSRTSPITRVILIYLIYWFSPLLVHVCWLLLVVHIMLLLIPVEFKLGNHPITPEIGRLGIFVVYQSGLSLALESPLLNCPKSCLTCSNRRAYSSYVSTGKRWLLTDFFFWLNEKSTKCRKCSFSGIKLDDDH